MKEELDFTKPARYEWDFGFKTFSIKVCAWYRAGYKELGYGEKWTWNVYANIFKSNVLFGNVGAAMNLPMHGGCTFDRKIVELKTGVNEWDTREPFEYLKVGCDYAHHGDDYYEDCNPKDGIPVDIQEHVTKLVEAIKNWG